MPDLQKAIVFLSASFPSGERGEKHRPYDAAAIADAVSGFARAILGSNGVLLFGAHPTITPLVLMVARELPARQSIVVFQSEWFKGKELPAVDELVREKLGFVRWTRRERNRDSSLRRMRHEMICSMPIKAALFIGGMEGISNEYELVREHSPETICVPVAGPGGAAGELLPEGWNALGLEAVHKSQAYPFVAQQLVEALARIG